MQRSVLISSSKLAGLIVVDEVANWLSYKTDKNQCLDAVVACKNLVIILLRLLLILASIGDLLSGSALALLLSKGHIEAIVRMASHGAFKIFDVIGII